MVFCQLGVYCNASGPSTPAQKSRRGIRNALRHTSPDSAGGQTNFAPAGSADAFRVARLTTGVTNSEIPIANTANFGAHAVAIAMVCVNAMTIALITTVPNPATMPAHAPIRVIHLLYKPQI